MGNFIPCGGKTVKAILQLNLKHFYTEATTFGLFIDKPNYQLVELDGV